MGTTTVIMVNRVRRSMSSIESRRQEVTQRMWYAAEDCSRSDSGDWKCSVAVGWESGTGSRTDSAWDDAERRRLRNSDSAGWWSSSAGTCTCTGCLSWSTWYKADYLYRLQRQARYLRRRRTVARAVPVNASSSTWAGSASRRSYERSTDFRRHYSATRPSGDDTGTPGDESFTSIGIGRPSRSVLW